MLRMQKVPQEGSFLHLCPFVFLFFVIHSWLGWTCVRPILFDETKVIRGVDETPTHYSQVGLGRGFKAGVRAPN